MRSTLCTLALHVALVIPGAARADDRIYLKCPIDGAPTAPGFDFIMDRAAMTLTHVPPGVGPQPPLQMRETETDYVSTEEHNGEVLFRIAINRYTLRFSAFNRMSRAFGGNENLRGQCRIVPRQL